MAVGGTVHLLVLPNANGFHNDLKKQIEAQGKTEYEVKIDANIDKFKMKLDKAEDQIDRLDGRKINLFLDVNDKEAAKAVDDFVTDAEKEKITKRIEIRSEEAAKQVRKFAREQKKDPITKHLLMDWEYADSELMDFEKKHDGKVLLQKVDLDFGSAERARKAYDEAYQKMDRLQRSGTKRVIGVRAEIEFDAAPIDSVNFLPRMLKGMNAQLDIGLRQIYDSYFTLFSNIYKITSKPFVNFAQQAREAKNFGELFKVIGKPFIDLGKQAKAAFSAIKSGLKSSKPLADQAVRGLKQLPAVMKELGQLAKLSFSAMRKGVSLLFSPAKKAAGAIGGLTKSLGRGLSNAAMKSTPLIANSFAFLANSAFKAFGKVSKGFGAVSGGAKKAGNAIKSGLGKAFSSLGGLAKKGFSAVVGFGKKVGPKLVSGAKRSAAAVGKVFSRVGSAISRTMTGAVMGITRSFRAMFPALTTAMSGFTRVFGAVFRKLGSTLLKNNAIYSVFRKMFARIVSLTAGFGRLMTGMFGKLAGVIFKSLLPALGAVMVAIGALAGQAAIGAVMALAGAFASVAGGAVLMLPAAIGAAAVAFGVLKMGLKGVKEGLSSALSASTVEEFEEAIAGLHPAVQSIARAMREFKGPIDDMKSAVQGNMLAGLDVGLKSTMNNLLPIFSTGAQNIATSWNKSLGGVLDELSSERASAGLTAIMAGVEEMSIAMEPTLRNLTGAFGSLMEQGAKFLGPLGGWINGLSESFLSWAEGMKAIDVTTGLSKFDTIMESAKKNAAYLGDIFGGLFGTLGNLLSASAEGGAGMLAGMGEGLRALQEATAKGTDGYEAILGFMEGATRAASALKVIVEPLLMSFVSVGQILADVAYGALPGVGVALTGLQNGLASMVPYAETFGKSMKGVFEAFAPLLESLGAALGPALVGLAAGLDQALSPLKEGGAFSGFFEELEKFGPIIGESLSVVGGALGKIIGAMAPFFESFMDVLNQFMPVFDIFAYWLGEIIAAVLKAIEPFAVMRDDAIGGLLEAIKPLLDVIGNGLMRVIQALSPIMVVLGAVFAALIKAVTPLIAPLTEIADRLFSALVDAINMVMPVIPILGAAIIKMAGIFSGILMVVLNNLIKIWDSMWPAISAVLKFAIQDIIIPIIHFLIDAVVWLAEKFMWLWQNIIDPAMTGITAVIGVAGDGIVWVFDHVIKPALDGLKKAFQAAVDAIGKIWDGLKKLFAIPVKFFVQTVLNDGIIAGWNAIGPKINLPEIKKVSIGDLGSYASGGVLPGYSPGRDNYNFVDPSSGARVSLAGGEAIMRPEWTSAVGGPKAVAAMNEAARHGRIKADRTPHVMNRANGGVLDFGSHASGGVLAKNPGVSITSDIQRAMEAAVAGAFPNQIITSATRTIQTEGHPDNHNAGRALDFAPSQALASWIQSTYPNSAELFWDAGPNIKNGNPTGAIGGHSDHVHWAMSSIADPYTGEIISMDGPGDGAGGGGTNPLAAAANALYNMTVKPLIEGAKKIFFADGAGESSFGKELVGGVVSTAIDGAINTIKNAISSLFGANEAGNSNWDPSAGAEQWRQGVIDAFIRQGEDPLPERVDALLRQITTESNGDPNIAQQIVDMNGTGASAGLGLYQFIPGTFAAYRDPGLPNDRTNPEAAHNAAVRYFRDRHNWNTGPGGVGLAKTGWADGGVLPEFFDQGGLARGVGLLQKNVITPERVLTPQMTKAFDTFIYEFLPELVSQFRNNPMEFAKHFAKLTGEVARVRKELRDGHIANFTETMLGEFRSRANGENLQVDPVDLNFDESWFARNETALAKNLEKASRRISNVVLDPSAYLEAEAAARKRLEEEFEAEREKAKEETDEAKKKAKEEEDKAREEKEKAEDEAAKTDEEKEALKKQREEEAKAREEVADKEKEAADAKTKEEEARIEAAKADGSFYYGYKTFDAEGKNPNATELSSQETAFRSFMDSVGERTGLGDSISGITKRVDMLRSIGEASQTAAPAWMAALNGDPTGLAYNVAVGTNQVANTYSAEAQDLAPSALVGVLEMALSSGVNSAPFIGEVNSGMTQAELMQTLDYYQGVRARRGTGTTRVR